MNQATNEVYVKESLEERSQKIATFLLLSDRVDSKKIAEILGPDKPLNNMIREDFPKLLNLKGKSLVISMRYYFINFLMTGEAQVIARILEGLTNHYERENPVFFYPSYPFLKAAE